MNNKMYQELWIVFTFEFFVLLAEQEQKQRTASLIVLPPLVLGYDELYEEKSPEGIETLKQKVKPLINPQAKGNTAENEKKLVNKDVNAAPNIKRSDVKFIRNGHKLNFMGHFLLPHDENDCPFHESPDPKFELMNIDANRRSLGNLNLRRNLENIVKSNLLKGLVSPHSIHKTVDKKGNLVVHGNVVRAPKAMKVGKVKETVTAKKKGVVKPKQTVSQIRAIKVDKVKEIVTAKKKGVAKPKQTISQRSFRPVKSNITEELLRDLAVGMLSGTLLN